MDVIIDEKLYDKIWDKIDNEFEFCPSIDKNIKPFELKVDYVCYQLNSVWNIEQEKMVNDIFKSLSNKEIYALNWNHDCFQYNPNENIQPEYYFYDNDRDVGVQFPTYYPNGDYHFFISKDWDYGMLGHPWRNELYIFGENLIHKFEKIQNKLDIIKK